MFGFVSFPRFDGFVQRLEARGSGSARRAFEPVLPAPDLVLHIHGLASAAWACGDLATQPAYALHGSALIAIAFARASEMARAALDPRFTWSIALRLIAAAAIGPSPQRLATAYAAMPVQVIRGEIICASALPRILRSE